MPKLLFLLLALSLVFSSASAREESLAERKLKSLVSRERAVFAQTEDGVAPVELETQVQQLVREYDLLIQANPEFVPGYVAYALLLRKAGQDKPALALFVHADRLDPTLAVVKNEIGNYLIEDAKYREAHRYYSEAISLEPAEPLYHLQMGNLLYEFRDHFVADEVYTREALDVRMLTAFRRAAELAPERIPFAYRYAEAFYDLAEPRWEEALRQWRALAERVAPGIESETIRLHLANVLIKLERFEEARALLEQETSPVLAENRKTLVDLLPKNAEN